MTPAELRCLREFLGLTTAWLADRLGIRERRLQRMEAGAEPIPDGVAAEIDDLAATTAEYVEQLLNEFDDTDEAATLITYRTDAAFKASGGLGKTFPASWHRAVAARVAEQIDTLTLEYSAEG
ncbi:DUF1870 family protein [Mycolicibacterium fortuitum]|uniref:Aca2/YdiL-like domain-containing protein n=1 Tax=Mycolicibacterium fortuitum TaxID=1766 RepID=UPI0013F4F9D0|nr:DUF1870 family protein [Mycolicibacterium fortuitum]